MHANALSQINTLEDHPHPLLPKNTEDNSPFSHVIWYKGSKTRQAAFSPVFQLLYKFMYFFYDIKIKE